MRKHDDLWHDINTLLAFLRQRVDGMDVPRMLGVACERYGNGAPEAVLRQQIDKLQKRLDEADE